MNSMPKLLNPTSIAVVGASQNRGRGTRVLINLRDLGFAGDVFAVHPKYSEVHGYPCFPTVAALPHPVDCVVAAVSADTACDVLNQCYEKGIRAAVVLAAGFGEGGHGAARAVRLQALAQRGMTICGPNCFGALNVKTGGAAYSGKLPSPLRPGSVALVSQSGGLGANVFTPLMVDRQLGFSHVISCGNQVGATIEDYVEHLVQDPDVTVVAAIVESLHQPQKLLKIAQSAHAQNKSLLFFHAGRSAAGKIMTQSHTGALTSDAEILAAHLRRCGIVPAETYDEFVEAVVLFAVARRDQPSGRDVIIVSGSGGGAAVAADSLDGTGMMLPDLAPATQSRIASALPEFGSVTNPIDGTGAMSDDPKLLPKLYEALLGDDSRAILATTVAAWPAGNKNGLRFAGTLANAARSSGRTVVAYQPSPLGGPLDKDIVETLHAANVPLLLGVTNSMKVLKYLPQRTEYRLRAAHARLFDAATMTAPATMPADHSFLAMRRKLAASGVAVVKARLVSSEEETIAAFREFGCPVAVKAEIDGLLHKSDIGCVKLNCNSDEAVIEAYRAVLINAKASGYGDVRQVLIQPMMRGIAEAYAGVINDPTFGPALTFGLGGIFVEIFKDTTTELAPLNEADAMDMIHRIKGAPLLTGARGRAPGDIEALAAFLARLGEFAIANYGQFHTLDLNPIVIGAAGEGVVAVDIAVEPWAENSHRGCVKSGVTSPA
jgi:acetyltransferase